jgi:hypothetical protein
MVFEDVATGPATGKRPDSEPAPPKKRKTAKTPAHGHSMQKLAAALLAQVQSNVQLPTKTRQSKHNATSAAKAEQATPSPKRTTGDEPSPPTPKARRHQARTDPANHPLPPPPLPPAALAQQQTRNSSQYKTMYYKNIGAAAIRKAGNGPQLVQMKAPHVSKERLLAVAKEIISLLEEGTLPEAEVKAAGSSKLLVDVYFFDRHVVHHIHECRAQTRTHIPPQPHHRLTISTHPACSHTQCITAAAQQVRCPCTPAGEDHWIKKILPTLQPDGPGTSFNQNVLFPE